MRSSRASATIDITRGDMRLYFARVLPQRDRRTDRLQDIRSGRSRALRDPPRHRDVYRAHAHDVALPRWFIAARLPLSRHRARLCAAQHAGGRPMIKHQGLTTCSLYKPAGVALLIMCIKVQSDDWLAASLVTIAKHPAR
jgi:hypothetical protein